MYDKYKNEKIKDDVSEDIVFEIYLVRQIVVNIDYILSLVNKYQKENNKNKEISADIIRAINSNPELKPKKELIERFIQVIDDTEDVSSSWIKFRNTEKEKEKNKIIESEKLKMPATELLIEKIFRIGAFEVSDADISEIMPAMSRFSSGNMKARLEKKQRIYDILNNFFLKYFD
jgi:type I restriction enzyme R subunit